MARGTGLCRSAQDLEELPIGQNIATLERHSVPLWRQLRTLHWRCKVIYWRSPSYNLVRTLLVMMLAFLFGTVYWRMEYEREDVFSRISFCYTTTFYVGLTFLLSGVTVLMSQRPVFYREQAARAYASWTYGAAFLLSELPYVTINSFLFLGITWFFSHLYSDAASHWVQVPRAVPTTVPRAAPLLCPPQPPSGRFGWGPSPGCPGPVLWDGEAAVLQPLRTREAAEVRGPAAAEVFGGLTAAHCVRVSRPRLRSPAPLRLRAPAAPPPPLPAPVLWNAPPLHEGGRGMCTALCLACPRPRGGGDSNPRPTVRTAHSTAPGSPTRNGGRMTDGGGGATTAGPVWPGAAVRHPPPPPSVGTTSQGKAEGEGGHEGVRDRWAPPPAEGEGSRE